MSKVDEYLEKIATETGYVCYEDLYSMKAQTTFFGTSDMFDKFCEMIGKLAIPTGTLAYIMDTGETKMYSAYKNAWF